MHFLFANPELLVFEVRLWVKLVLKLEAGSSFVGVEVRYGTRLSDFVDHIDKLSCFHDRLQPSAARPYVKTSLHIVKCKFQIDKAAGIFTKKEYDHVFHCLLYPASYRPSFPCQLPLPLLLVLGSGGEGFCQLPTGRSSSLPLFFSLPTGDVGRPGC